MWLVLWFLIRHIVMCHGSSSTRLWPPVDSQTLVLKYVFLMSIGVDIHLYLTLMVLDCHVLVELLASLCFHNVIFCGSRVIIYDIIMIVISWLAPNILCPLNKDCWIWSLVSAEENLYWIVCWDWTLSFVWTCSTHMWLNPLLCSVLSVFFPFHQVCYCFNNKQKISLQFVVFTYNVFFSFLFSEKGQAARTSR